MDDGSAVILSVAKYYSPSGISIQDKGVTPTVQQAEADTAATDDDDDSDAPPATAASQLPPKGGIDSVLQKTFEIIKK
jgi:carboxyl-terminal processing protease